MELVKKVNDTEMFFRVFCVCMFFLFSFFPNFLNQEERRRDNLSQLTTGYNEFCFVFISLILRWVVQCTGQETIGSAFSIFPSNNPPTPAWRVRTTPLLNFDTADF